jgi:membrane-associated HD superfamily phosphohydrolase
MKVLLRLTHPISLGIILIFYSLLMGVATITFRTPWFFYLLVLVFLGGVIILIIYIRTLAANEKFIAPKSFNLFAPVFIIFIRIFFINNYNYTLKSSFNTRILINLYEYSNRRISIFLITYLLITMVCVVKLVKFERGPLVGRL